MHSINELYDSFFDHNKDLYTLIQYVQTVMHKAIGVGGYMGGECPSIPLAKLNRLKGAYVLQSSRISRKSGA